MASYPAYVPAPDGAFDTWVKNFDVLLAADPAKYGLEAADATNVTTAVAPWITSYPISQDPPTRTSVTVAQKDSDRAAAEAVVRPYAVRISRNSAVLDADKSAIGVTVPSQTPTPIPPPVDKPELGLNKLTPGVAELTFKTTGAEGKSKPFGSVNTEIYVATGEAHAVDPATAIYAGDFNKSPFRLRFDASKAGNKLTVFARFKTQSGPEGTAQVGPWSNPLQTIVA